MARLSLLSASAALLVAAALVATIAAYPSEPATPGNIFAFLAQTDESTGGAPGISGGMAQAVRSNATSTVIAQVNVDPSNRTPEEHEQILADLVKQGLYTPCNAERKDVTTCNESVILRCKSDKWQYDHSCAVTCTLSDMKPGGHNSYCVDN